MNIPSRQVSPLLVALALALGLSATASGQALKTARGELLLPSAEGGSYVRSADGQGVELPLPKAARVSDLRSTATGWFAAAVARDQGTPALRLFRGHGETVEALPSPASAPARELLQPIFVAGRDEIQGLIWLAGEAHHQLAVTAARWSGGSWSDPEIVSPPGKGTQIALSSALLDDGSWLVVWAAFDGTDDEIVWSRRSAGSWSPPRPVARGNAVPDITPHLFATPGGALVAWSRYDGNDYRVNVARFDGEAWSPPTVVGPKGSTAPAFSDTDAPYLVHHLADPQAWAVLELDRSGHVLREASAEVPVPGRPILARVSSEGVVFEWPSLESPKSTAPLRWIERTSDRR